MLNYTPEQLEAINTINDNLQIIACAGSGKTQVISQRIVNILKSEPSIHPQNIVAFTYTEKAAAELKSRVLKLCKEQLPDTKGLVDMYIGTIHRQLMSIVRESKLTTPDEAIPEDIRKALTNYEQTLSENAYFDFTMIMTRALHHLKEDLDFSAKIGSILKYLIVDEYQDVNPSRLLSGVL